MNVILHRFGGGSFIFINVNEDIHVAPHEWEHADLAEKISDDILPGHHTYGMGAGVGGINWVSFYGYSDGITGDWPEGKQQEIADALVEEGIVAPNPELRDLRYSKFAANYNQLQAERFWAQQYPDEAHNLGGDCLNPKCDYQFTPEDEQTINSMSGWFTCPKCGWTYNYLEEEKSQKTRSGLSMDQMGNIGETIIEELGTIPGMGTVINVYGYKNNPIDATIGNYGAEIKTIHSEAQQRFKMGGENVYVPSLGKTVRPKESKEIYCEQHGLRPALVGVRLNFYTDIADIFIREGMTDTWIGNPKLKHVGSYNFSHLNPFKHPHDVPPTNQLPADDETPPVDPDSDIPF